MIEQPTTLVIGPGGGRDVLAALASGAPHVTAVEVNPADGEGHYLLGILLEATKGKEEAISAYEKGVAEAPNTYSPLYNQLGVLYQNMGRQDEAMVCYRDGLKVNWGGTGPSPSAGIPPFQ